jgi:hypothetical protein
LERASRFAVQAFIGGAGDENLPGFGKRFQTSGDVNAITKYIILLENDFTYVYPNSQLQCILAGQRVLNGDSTGHSVRD